MRTIAALALALALTACGGGDGKAEGTTESDEGAETSASPAAPEQTPTTNAPPADPGPWKRKVGQPQPLEAGGSITVRRVVIAPTPQWAKDGSAASNIGIDLRMCVGDSGSPLDADPFAYAFQAANGTIVQPTSLHSGFLAPQFPTFITVNPGECVEGWIQIATTRRLARSAQVVQLRDASGPAVEWKLPQQLPVEQWP